MIIQLKFQFVKVDHTYIINNILLKIFLDYVAYVKHKVYCNLAVPLRKGTHLHTHDPPMAACYSSVYVFVLLT